MLTRLIDSSMFSPTIPSQTDLERALITPPGWVIKSRRYFSIPEGMNLHIKLLLVQQQFKTQLKGTLLYPLIRSLNVVDASYLDYLMGSRTISETENVKPNVERFIFFWGTLYISGNGKLAVRCLYNNGGHWEWGYRLLDHYWDARSPAAVFTYDASKEKAI